MPPVIANAIYDAVGVRVDEVPITPDKVLAAIRAKAQGKDGRYGPRLVPDVEWPEPLRVATPPKAATEERFRVKLSTRESSAIFPDCVGTVM